jgi:DnaK suppressor protein
VSKSPAKKAPARSKAAAGKAAPRKSAAKPATKPKAPAKVAKPAAKPTKHPAKPATKPTAKAAPKASGKPAAKPVAKAAPAKAKPVAKDLKPAVPMRPTTPVKPAAPKPTIAAMPRVGAATVKPSSPAPQPATSTLPKNSEKQLASPAAAAASIRFTERFAPPRPPQRVLVEPIEPVRPVIKSDPRLANAWKNKLGRDLSEDELLAMPDDVYMNDKQLEFFRLRLQALKDDLLSNAGETTEHLREDTSIVPDPADRATIEEEHALELRTRDRERKLLKKITQSLSRIEAGDYGYCDETGEPIGLGRLLARPTATLSLEAQQRRELKQKMFGD